MGGWRKLWTIFNFRVAAPLWLSKGRGLSLHGCHTSDLLRLWSVGGQEFYEGSAGDAVGGVVEDAVDPGKQLNAVQTARGRGAGVGYRESVQPQGWHVLAAAVDGYFHAVGIGFERYVHAFALPSRLRDRLAANVAGGAGELSAVLRLKSRVNRLMFHGAAEHADQIPALVHVEDDAYRLIGHCIETSDSATLISQASRQSGQ